MTFIIRARDAALDDPLGGKARALAALRPAELFGLSSFAPRKSVLARSERRHCEPLIPDWFVVTPAAFHASLTPQQSEALKTSQNAEQIRTLLQRLRPHAAVEAELQTAVRDLCPAGELLAVRSSACDEDGPEHSFAGQLDSFLFVAAENVAEKVAAVWLSGFGERVLAYRREHGLSPLPQAPAVLVQRMVQAELSGVAFGADPVSGRQALAVVGATFGVGTRLVSGECDADTYHVDREGRIVQRTLAARRTAQHDRNGDGALSDKQIQAVAELVRCTSRHFGRPQDIEWAIAAGRLFLLQSRPITSLGRAADPDGVLTLWDNSNIAESYNGITTPLTFSFARGVYEEVYRQFCKILRVPADVLSEHDTIFSHMLGLIRGRIYYNLLSWYRMLTLLPGFKANRRFMEQMMGVKEPLPDHLVAELKGATWRERWRDRFRFVGSVLAMVRNHFSLGRQIGRFYRRLQIALEPAAPAKEARTGSESYPANSSSNTNPKRKRGSSNPSLALRVGVDANSSRQAVDLSQLRPDELAAHYRSLERQLLTRWDAPLVNDFFAMIFYGVLGKLTRKWCGDAAGTLQNDLLCGEGGMISAEPAQRVLEMAKTALDHPDLTAALCDGSRAEIQPAMRRVPAFCEQFQAYLSKFGDRCLEELKLESDTLHDDPMTLLRSIGRQTRRLQEGAAEQTDTSAPRRRAEQRVRQALRFRPLRRLIFGWVLRNARARVRDRENLRFERTRLFGRVRRIFVELGQRFHALGVLEQPRDVFYLEVNEALGFVDGTTASADLKGLVAVRQAEFERYRHLEKPADRFETHGTVQHGNTFQAKTAAAAPTSPDDDRRRGLGCCPGVVRGPVRVVTDPRRALLQAGDILVAERTDPGWIMLFPSAAGILVERGSLLSHSAIVARELGIPAVVAIAGVTGWLKDGDWVEFDGGSGEVRRIDAR